jgi:AcrR family transcriptional regulator
MFDMETPFDLLPSGGSRYVPAADPLVEDLDWLPTGILLSAALDRLDRSRLSGHDRISLLQARTRLISHLQAEQLADINSIRDAITELVAERSDDPFVRVETGFDDTATEVSAALTLDPSCI